MAQASIIYKLGFDINLIYTNSPSASIVIIIVSVIYSIYEKLSIIQFYAIYLKNFKVLDFSIL